MSSNLTRIDSLPGAIGEARAASTAGGGTALTSTAGLIVIPDGTVHLQLLPRNLRRPSWSSMR